MSGYVSASPLHWLVNAECGLAGERDANQRDQRSSSRTEPVAHSLRGPRGGTWNSPEEREGRERRTGVGRDDQQERHRAAPARREVQDRGAADDRDHAASRWAQQRGTSRQSDVKAQLGCTIAADDRRRSVSASHSSGMRWHRWTRHETTPPCLICYSTFPLVRFEPPPETANILRRPWSNSIDCNQNVNLLQNNRRLPRTKIFV